MGIEVITNFARTWANAWVAGAPAEASTLPADMPHAPMPIAQVGQKSARLWQQNTNFGLILPFTAADWFHASSGAAGVVALGAAAYVLAPVAWHVGKSLWQHGSLRAAYAQINREVVNRFLAGNIDAHEAVLDDIARDTTALRARYTEDLNQLNEEIDKLTTQLQGPLSTNRDLATEKRNAETSLRTARTLLAHIEEQVAALDKAINKTIPQERTTIADRRTVQLQLSETSDAIARIRTRVESSVTRIAGIEENVAQLDDEQVDLLGRLEDIGEQNRDALAESSANFEAETGHAPIRVVRKDAEPDAASRESARDRALRSDKAKTAQRGRQ